MKLFTIAAALLTFATIGFAQDHHRLNGVVKTKDLAVVPGLSLSVERNGKEYSRGGFSDINGRFELDLEPGKYKVTAFGLPESDFVLHLTIDDGPRPQDLDLTIDVSSLCESTGKRPSILKSAMPAYPPAARAVRGVGTVSVAVKVRPDGSVESAKAVSGHPLLRRASEAAAGKFLFEGSANEGEREVNLAFVFVDGGVRNASLNRYECPYRVIVYQEAPTIEN